jgi:hypothetical protein
MSSRECGITLEALYLLGSKNAGRDMPIRMRIVGPGGCPAVRNG